MTTGLRDSIKPSGHLEITKIYKDGHHEVVYSQHNIITVGMGINLSELFAAAESSDPSQNSMESYKIKYFQIGTGGDGVTSASSLTSLGTPCTLGQYGTNPDIDVFSHNLWQNGAIAQKAFAAIKDEYTSKSGSTGVSFKFDIGIDVANGVGIDELGIFASDPFRRLWTADNVRASVLCAYRKFPEISKTNDFALSFKWTITF